MQQRFLARRRAPLTILLALFSSAALAQWAATAAVRGDNSGPWNVTILEGGEGLMRPLSAENASLEANGPWSMTGWVNPRRQQPGSTVLFGVGSSPQDGRVLMLTEGEFVLFVAGRAIRSGTPVDAGKWTAVAATYDGQRARLYVKGRETGGEEVSIGATAGQLHVAPVVEMPDVLHFGGRLAEFKLHRSALDPKQVQALYAARPDFDVLVFHEVGGHWPWQVKQWRGLQEPQDPWTLPRGKAPFSKPMARTLQPAAELALTAPHTWALRRWRLAEAPKVAAKGPELSRTNYSDESWHVATVPGTVLTTLIDRGVYPDYDHGLNNMAIPESLARQDYWYRSSFEAPASLDGRQLTLTFKGINYAAEVWVNGGRLGDIRGAFIRGVFDVTGRVLPGKRNVIAVRVSPPPHPGIPHEESIAAGPGENGGWVALDGPTFAASEGWDWIPGIRDRNTGIWQDVELHASGRVRILDPQVVTTLPLPRTDTADIAIMVPVDSTHAAPVEITVTAQFADVSLSKTTQRFVRRRVHGQCPRQRHFAAAAHEHQGTGGAAWHGHRDASAARPAGQTVFRQHLLAGRGRCRAPEAQRHAAAATGALRGGDHRGRGTCDRGAARERGQGAGAGRQAHAGGPHGRADTPGAVHGQLRHRHAGEPRRVIVSYPARLGTRAALNLRGWNVRPASTRIREMAPDNSTEWPRNQVWTPAKAVSSAEITLPRRQ